MSFVIDSAEWLFDEWPVESVERALDSLLERVQVADERGEVVWIGDSLQTRVVFGHQDLWSLAGPDSPLRLSTEIWQELSAWLLRAPRYADEPAWPEGFDVVTISIDGSPEVENIDVAWAHHRTRAGLPTGCISMLRSGPLNTVSVLGNVTLYWVGDESTHRVFWRNAIDVIGDSPQTLEQMAPHAYPDIFFREGVWGGLGEFVGGYWPLRQTIRSVLEGLDDYGNWIFLSPPPALFAGDAVTPGSGRPSNQLIERRFVHIGLEIAPENPDVYRDRVAREAREITIGGNKLYCEWHFKLQPHQNRIHVHAPVNGTEGRVILAFFTEHLPLPH